MKKKVIVIAHLLFWFLAMIIELLPLTGVDDPVKIHNVLIEEVFMSAFCILIFYFFYFFLAPNILSKRKIVLFVIVMLSFIAAYTGLIMLIYPKILFSIIEMPKKLNYTIWFFSMVSYHFVYALWGTMFRFTIDWFKSIQKQKELEKQNVSTELALLRSQVNPHFLFNTLNNINSYVTRDPDIASYSVIKLSDIMRYMLYEATAEKVLLDQEIEYINSYIALQKLRVKDPGFIEFITNGNTSGIMIPPMLLIPFIENAFKHGSKINVSPAIVIRLEVVNEQLSFYIMNYIPAIKEVIADQGGLGLKNIRRRLDLLFGKNYSLAIREEGGKFEVNLKLSLS